MRVSPNVSLVVLETRLKPIIKFIEYRITIVNPG